MIEYDSCIIMVPPMVGSVASGWGEIGGPGSIPDKKVINEKLYCYNASC